MTRTTFSQFVRLAPANTNIVNSNNKPIAMALTDDPSTPSLLLAYQAILNAAVAADALFAIRNKIPANTPHDGFKN